MLTVKSLYKSKDGVHFNGLDFEVPKGKLIGIECTDEASCLLFDMLLGKEVPAMGAIQYSQEKDIRAIFKDEGYPEDSRVLTYLNVFARIYNQKNELESILDFMGLQDIKHKRIKKLNYSQKRRLSFARELLNPPAFLMIQEPIANLDRMSLEVVMNCLMLLRDKGTSILATASSLKDVMIFADIVYSLEDDVLVTLDSKNTLEEVPFIKGLQIEKIPAKLEERIILFDPNEIDYIECLQGDTLLSVKGEKFSTPLSISELEERLYPFGFFRSHRSYLVNLQRVREVVTWSKTSYSLCLEDKPKSVVPLSKGRINDFKELFKL